MLSGDVARAAGHHATVARRRRVIHLKKRIRKAASSRQLEYGRLIFALKATWIECGRIQTE